MAYQFKNRSTTPTEYRLTDDACAHLFAEQYGEDVSAVLEKVSSIKDDTTILGETGTYDFTAAIAAGYTSGEAAQYATDQAEVTAKADHLQSTETICGIAGTLNMGLWELVTTGDTRVAAQLTTDKAAVTAGKADILNSRTILTITGTFDLAANDVVVAAAQKVTDAAFLETWKAEIITTDTNILAEFGVTGTAVTGSATVVGILGIKAV